MLYYFKTISLQTISDNTSVEVLIMQFFSVYDLLLNKVRETKRTPDDMYTFFRTRKIKKTQIVELQQTAFIPAEENFRKALCDFLNMTELEIELSMGRIPASYRDSYFQNIKEIAHLLSKAEDNTTSHFSPYYENELGCLYNGDCIKIMRSLPDACVDLVFADPPFNLGKVYDPGIDDSLTVSKYINWTYEWLDECVRIIKPGGRIFIYNLPKWCVYIASHLGESLTFWAWIAIDMKFSLPIQSRLYPAHYGLVAFIKGTKATTFNNQRIPLQVCRHCGGELKDYGGYKNKMNPLGVNVSDVWTDIYPVRHKSDKNRKYNELSVKLLNRIISMATNEGDIVFDPFGGSGTTYAVAQLLNRKWMGCELGDCGIIKHRLINSRRDKEQLERIQEESGCLFTPPIMELRRKNGFWICEDFKGKDDTESTDGQLALDFSQE